MVDQENASSRKDKIVAIDSSRLLGNRPSRKQSMVRNMVDLRLTKTSGPTKRSVSTLPKGSSMVGVKWRFQVDISVTILAQTCLLVASFL